MGGEDNTLEWDMGGEDNTLEWDMGGEDNTLERDMGGEDNTLERDMGGGRHTTAGHGGKTTCKCTGDVKTYYNGKWEGGGGRDNINIDEACK